MVSFLLMVSHNNLLKWKMSNYFYLGELKGDYFPLHGSRSYAPKPNGMTLEKEEELRSAGNLFQEPDSTLLLSGGMGRHWPDARGIFHNNDKNLFVWVNEGKI